MRSSLRENQEPRKEGKPLMYRKVEWTLDIHILGTLGWGKGKGKKKKKKKKKNLSDQALEVKRHPHCEKQMPRHTRSEAHAAPKTGW
jgi:hypothetical protein